MQSENLNSCTARSIVQYCIIELLALEGPFHALSRSGDLKIACKNANHYSRFYATDSELILAQLEPMYEIEANPTKIHLIPLFQFWVKN